MAEVEHKLVGNSLKREGDGIVARCGCGWESKHFSSLTASAAFRDHRERCGFDARDPD